jgi:DNA-binding NarL/FixJ family response regulator
MNRMRILLADDHREMLDRVAAFLQSEFEVVGKVQDGQSLIEAATKLEPDVLVVDISMPVLSGIEATRQLKKEGCKTKVVFLTVHDEPDFARASLEAGALGYVVKSRLVSDLIVAIQEALAGRRFVSPSIELST